MKKAFLTLTLALTTATTFSYQCENPYYDFIAHNSYNFVSHLNEVEVQECLNALIGNSAKTGTWFEKMCACIEPIMKEFTEAYDECCQLDILQNRGQTQHMNEFGSYVVLTLYRMIYTHAQTSNFDETYLKAFDEKGESSNHNLPTPHELDALYTQALAE